MSQSANRSPATSYKVRPPKSNLEKGVKINSMIDSSRRQNLENVLFALAFGLALAVRLLRLGEIPLSDDEARWAMQAVDLAKGLHPEIGPQPAYVLLTALIFYVSQASNFAARLIPALAGSLLVFAPIFFRDRLGNKAALVLAFVLALEPGLLAMSREAGSPIIVLSAVIFACGFWRAGNLPVAGILAGVALLSGPALWPGLIGLAIAYGLSRGLLSSEGEEGAQFDRQSLITAGVYALGAYLALGSLFLLVPVGLGAGVASLPAYLRGWVSFNDVPSLRLAAALAFYQPLAIALAAAGLIRGIRNGDRLVISLGLWLLASLILALAYPSHQVTDLAWALIPLWALACMEVARYLLSIQDGVWETLGMLALTLAILFFAGTNFITIALVSLDSETVVRNIGPIALTSPQVYWSVVLGALVLLAASVALVAYGWSKQVAYQGSLWGVLVALVIYTLSASMGAANLRTSRTVELWPSNPRTMQADALLGQMNDLSRAKAGAARALDVSVSGLDSPALRWLLRDWNAIYSSELALIGAPSFVIVPDDELSAPELASAYRGQNFTWRDNPAWNTIPASDWLRWIILHEVSGNQEKIILWTRSDIFSDSQNITTP
jgi:hypothetical protein